MRTIRFWAVSGFIAVSLACAPRVTTQSTPRGLKVYGEMIKYGKPETTLISLSVSRKDGAPSWKAEFADGSIETIVAEDIPGLTILKWKVDSERVKTLTDKPFQLTLKSGDLAYTATVSFRSAGREFPGHLLAEVVVRLIVGR